jgi:cell division protein FtsB
MVTRRRLRSFLTTLGLYMMAALLIGYFGVNAFSGNRGLKAKQDIDQQMAKLSHDLAILKLQRVQWERRIALLKSNGLDPDMLQERAAELLDYVGPNDLVLMLKPEPRTAQASPDSSP